MPTDSLAQRRTRWITIGLVVGLHAALLLVWRHTREKKPPPEEESGPRIQWIEAIAARPVARPPPSRAIPAPAPRAASVHAARPSPAARAPAIALPAAPPAPAAEAPSMTVVPPDPFAEPAPAAAPSAADTIRKRALADLGKIDKDLRKQSLNKFSVPDDSPQKRLIAGIQSARRAPTLFEKAEIEEITTGNADAGGRKYKIRTALGTYCITYPLVNDIHGSREKKYSLCPD
ncbi:hypothetical protein [Massilia antarctica]|uniref:hypothetical protein n=1 Tax=Massilia antarctica TaxID=2765360 RepID=UPI0006BDAA4F|nr:hypothetical protein [Massilia sp. H27-R4]MCY0915514.1 hypothetical protein [Massilia sp. H27-R4]CUI04136.1 hypothetical protein BN2497_3049 [Janthinobacterium sp. CG23_2]CUU27922.1 hypothetical protein BN3177_3049 [Janthinobacterium sp. CG23_2]